MILQSTPVLTVADIEESEAFFVNLGFRRTVEVPHLDGIGFVILTLQGDHGDNGISVMLETPEAGEADTSLPADTFQPGSRLFMSVADLDTAERELAGYEVILSRRDTFYGATEIGWREPGGNYVIIAQFAANSPDEA
jgi:catechol 2,3-dioxygenase-like lactoylglutathione lyase family enzyme